MCSGRASEGIRFLGMGRHGMGWDGMAWHGMTWDFSGGYVSRREADERRPGANGKRSLSAGMMTSEPGRKGSVVTCECPL
jgi:hypothetical protein